MNVEHYNHVVAKVKHETNRDCGALILSSVYLLSDIDCSDLRITTFQSRYFIGNELYYIFVFKQFEEARTILQYIKDTEILFI